MAVGLVDRPPKVSGHAICTSPEDDGRDPPGREMPRRWLSRGKFGMNECVIVPTAQDVRREVSST